MSDMPQVFNLIEASWLPVRRRSGAIQRIAPWRINDRIGEDPIVAFAWPRPDFNGAAHELLIGLLSTAAAPEDDDWEDWWWNPPAPGILEERFARVAHAFDLDGPGPRFLQDLDPLEDADGKEIAALLIDAPGAQTLRNNADLFVKRGSAQILSRAAAAMALYTLNAYAPEGGRGYMTSLRGGGPMTTLIIADHRDYGATLWGRLWPNVETREQIEGRASNAMTSDDPALIFPWLVPTRTSNRKTGRQKTTPGDVHPLQVYWGMPRRIRLLFESAQDRSCGLTGDKDSTVVTGCHTRNDGAGYSEGFEHPLTPYCRVKTNSPIKLAVRPKLGKISYRLWPGLVCESSDKRRNPAQVVRHWRERAPRKEETRLVAFGYEMNKNKALAWIESEMPLWILEDATSRKSLEQFIRYAAAGAETVTRLLTKEIKTALYGQPPKKKTNRSYELPKKTSGDYGFIAERFYRETEPAFYAALREVVRAIEEDPDGDDPTLRTREGWAPIMADAAMRLFDEYAPMDGLEGRNMERHVEARFFLTLALGGRGKDGRSLFERDLGIASPETARVRKGRKEAA